MKTVNKLFATAALALCLPLSANQSQLAGWQLTLQDIQTQWAHVNYELSGDEQEKAFEKLSEKAAKFAEQYQDKPESHIWNGIVKSSFAGAKGGLGALGLAKQAKAELEAAIKIDGQALSGSAYTSLATLYSKVPGWPIGFGSDKKARKMFEKSLAINPQGIDVNYFYGEFLYDEREYKQAKTYLEKAKAAPKRADRPMADKYRQQEIDALLAKVAKKLKR